ncbi:RNA polymerase sigma factor [Sporosarcina sp. ACRSL]|uniref:RNA polymerase sigma factor n=1 Tax=Sporosarcina sp. ACRSL TaxID=2918215 RepID=UPI001EF5C677|nr:RNA polymerase sigma factor [Sporosarcina sp. ACRSL]MCG7343654.1 RNA polymerase sigma factor [Sporosarcina sp. ACRSL]
MQVNHLFDCHLPDLKRYCYMITGNPWDGDDLYQDTLMNIMKRSSNLTNHPNPKGYLLKTATNQWRDTLRKKRREVVGEDTKQILSTVDNSLIESMEILLALLPFKQTAVIVLTEYFCYSSKDIARMLHMTTGGVKAALNRGRTTLAKMKNAQMNNDEPIHSLLNRLLTGLRSNDFRSVVTTYHLLVSRGVKISNDDQYFTFELHDPEGNIFSIREKI